MNPWVISSVRAAWRLVFRGSTTSTCSAPYTDPPNVEATVLTSQSIAVTWDPSVFSSIRNYIISFTTTSPFASSGEVRVNGADTSASISNLEENTLYTVKIQSVLDNGAIINSSKIYFKTWSDGRLKSAIQVY